MADKEKLTNSTVLSDFYCAYESKRELLKKQREDFEFRLGKQWKKEDVVALERKGVLVITDNRIQANIFLLTGLERQNRTDIKAFPEGAEDSIEADIATSLLKNTFKVSNGNDKISESFDAGVTVGESSLEMFLDSTYNFLNPTTKWKKLRSDMIFPEPGWNEYDYSDAGYVYKWTRGLKRGELISLYPEKKAMIKDMEEGHIRPLASLNDPGNDHVQFQDYPTESNSILERERKGQFDLLERYYKKWIERVFVIDKQKQTLTLVNVEKDDTRTELEVAEAFVKTAQEMSESNIDRYSIIERTIPEIWVYAITGTGDKALVDERAWFYPKWKGYPFMNYFANWTDAILSPEDQHLNVQGIVRGVVSTQQLHNKAETLKLRHLNSSANSGWISEEDSWVDSKMVNEFGSTPGINLEFKKGKPKPERIFPMQISGGHELVSRDTSEAIKAQLGINSDLLSSAAGGTESGRAIALRQRQGIVMVQKLFDNLSRTKRIMGQFTISQFNEIYDVETVKKVLGQAYLVRTFGDQVQDPETGETKTEIDEERMSATILKVLNDAEIGRYDVSVGEGIASDTKRMADFQEIQQFAKLFPNLVSPEMIIKESNLPPNVKDQMLSGIQQNRAQTVLNSPVVSANVANQPEGQSGIPNIGGQ